MIEISRRELIVGSATGAAGILLPYLGQTPSPDRKRSLRIAHLTDIHVQPERGAPKGLEACLAHAQGQKDKPDMILTGGDLIMDALATDKERVKVCWDTFQAVMKSNVELPIQHAIGNHDVFGWSNRQKYEKDPLYGKAWACDILELDKPYRSFDQAGWHFIVLDSTFPEKASGYTARLDDEQFEWLADDLEKTPKDTPVFILSHIPILAVCAFFDGENEKSGNWVIPGAWVHIDARRIKELFKKHPNVKICVSGHEHLLDEVVYLGVSYFCNGAVCGGWWQGDYHECTYGYTLIDLYDDGSFENHYVPYGWKTQDSEF